MFLRMIAMLVSFPACSGGPVILRPRGERDREVDVLLEQIALGRERGGGATNAGKIVVAGSVALLDRQPRIPGGFAIAPGPRERNRRPREDQALRGAADLGVAEIPPGVAAQRHRHL